MLVISWLGSWKLWRHGELPPLLLKICIAMTFSGWAATLAGWYVTEIGRQPWLVQGVLRTADAVTDVAPENIALSLGLYMSLYIVLMGAFLHTVFLMARRAVDIEEISDQDLPPAKHSKTINPI